MVFKVAGIFGCIFMLLWLGLFMALLIDTVFTGASEWAPWAAAEAAARGEYIAGYAVALAFGAVVAWKICPWTIAAFR